MMGTRTRTSIGAQARTAAIPQDSHVDLRGRKRIYGYQEEGRVNRGPHSRIGCYNVD